jgi:hypothetical protein
MLDRRAAIRLALAALPAAWLVLSPPAGAQDFQKFAPFLVDLPGWTADEAHGKATWTPFGDNIMATRPNKRGSAKLSAGIVSGPLTQGFLFMRQKFMKDMKNESHGVRMSMSQVDGFTVLQTFVTNEPDNVCTIMVALSSNTVFNLVSHGIPEDEALELARRFDSKAIRGALPK